MWCVARELRQAARGGGKHYQLAELRQLVAAYNKFKLRRAYYERKTLRPVVLSSVLPNRTGWKKEKRRERSRVKECAVICDVSLVSAQPKQNKTRIP